MNKTILGILSASILFGAVVIAGCSPSEEATPPAATGDGPVSKDAGKSEGGDPPKSDGATEDAGKMEGAPAPATTGG